MKEKIVLATDHAGFEMKEAVKEELQKNGYDVHDCGAYAFDADDDYPEYIAKAAREVSKNPTMTRAVIFGGSGQGEAIVANRFLHVRAAVFYGGSEDVIILSREHNDANILSLGARFLTLPEAKEAVMLWLDTKYTREERHARRIKDIDRVCEK